MAATITDVKNTVNNQSISDGIVTLALSDAAIYLISYGVSLSDPNYDILHRLYAAHLLFLRGVARLTSSDSVGDVSTSYDNSFVSNTGPYASPYLEQFFLLLGRDTLLTSI